MGRHPRIAPALLAVLVALVAVGCESSATSTTAQVGSDITEAAITSCLDTARAGGFSLSADDCMALDEIGLLCDNGLPECGAGLGGEEWLRACKAINVYYLGGDPETPLGCSEAQDSGRLCDNGWPENQSGLGNCAPGQRRPPTP